MKMPRMKFDTEKLQLFLFHHVEKLVLGLVVCVMAFLIWQGFRLEGLDKSKTPQGLSQKSEEMLAFIDTPTRWNEVGRDRIAQVPMTVAQMVDIAQKRTDALAYSLPVSINRPSFPKHNPRTDPELLPPEHVIVVPFIGPLAVLAKQTDVDPLFELPAADLEPPVVIKPKKAKPKKGYGPGEDPMYGSPDGGYGPGMPGPGGAKKKKGRNNRYGPSDATAGIDAYSPQPGYGSGYGYGDASMVGPDSLIYPESVNEGFMLQNAEITIAKPAYAMTIMAVVPILKQIEKFEKALADSLDFDSSRDFPQYLKFEVQRADVTADPTGAIDWTKAVLIDPIKVQVQQLGRPERPELNLMPEWAGIVPEVVDMNYLDAKLTHPAPPLLKRDLWPFLTHPDVPLATATQMGVGEYGPGMPGAPGTVPSDEASELFGLPGAAGAQPGMPGGMPGMQGMRGSADGGYGGYRGGGEAGYGMGRGSAMAGMGGYGGGGGYGRSGYSESGYGQGYGQPGTTYTPPKYKLIRMTDTRVEPYHKYSYRVRVWLHDPNHPATTLGFIAPSLASLDDQVKKRIKAVDDEVKAGRKKLFEASVVMTDWSASSAPAELPPLDRFYAISMTAPKERELLKGKPLVPDDQTKAETLVVKFDGRKVVDVSAEQTVARGTVLNLIPDPKADPALDPKVVVLKVIHPVTKGIVELPKYGFVTGAVVADIQGGEMIGPPLDKNNPNTLQAPCEMLVIDAAGRLRVLNEVDDIEGIHRFGFRKPPPMPTTAPGSEYPGGEYDPLGNPDGGRSRRPTRG